MSAFQLAASVVLLLVALDMLRAQRSRVQERSEEMAAGVEQTGISFRTTPRIAGRHSRWILLRFLGLDSIPAAWFFRLPVPGIALNSGSILRLPCLWRLSRGKLRHSCAVLQLATGQPVSSGGR
jgi:hypothetical protein